MLIDTSNAGKETSQTSLLGFSNWVHSAHFPGLEPMETPGVCSSFYIRIKITSEPNALDDLLRIPDGICNMTFDGACSAGRDLIRLNTFRPVALG